MLKSFFIAKIKPACHFSLSYKIKVLISFKLHHMRFQWAKHNLFTGNDLSMERVGLKYQIWSDSTKEGLVFEDQTWRVQSNKRALNEQKKIKIGFCYRILAQIGI